MNPTIIGKSPRSVDRNFIASLSHGLAVLEAVADSAEDVSLAILASRVGLKKTTTWRLLHTLVTLGYIHQNPQTHHFRPAPRVISLGYGYFDSLDLKQLSGPLLHDLSTRLNETVSLAILDDDELIYIDRVTTKQIVNINLHVGSRLPLYSTSAGRALISEMPKVWLRRYMEGLEVDPKASKYIREGGKRLLNTLKETNEHGYALNDEELVKGLRAVASPIRDRTSKIVGAVNVSVPSSRATISELRRTFVPSLLETVGKISLALGFRENLRTA